MTRTMYDAVNVQAAIPDNPQMIAGYIDGNYQSFAGLAARFPNAVHVPIAVWPSTNDGLVLDVETGDATPEQAPPWVLMRRAAGVTPSVYCGQASWQSVRDQFAAQGVPEPPYWIASYPGPGEGVMIPGAVAHQWGGDTDGGYDVSVVADYWDGVDGSSPSPTDLMEDFMYALKAAAGTPQAGYVALVGENHVDGFLVENVNLAGITVVQAADQADWDAVIAKRASTPSGGGGTVIVEIDYEKLAAGITKGIKDL